MATILEVLATAVQHHQEGRLPAAEQIYRQILTIDPNHADAWHLLGVIASQTGNQEVAVKCIRQAIEFDPSNPAFHCNLGNAFKAQRRLHEAENCYRRALQLQPGDAGTYYNLGIALLDQKRLGESIACLRRALELNPDLPEAHNNLGKALQTNDQLDEAVNCYRQALVLQPELSEAHNNLGSVFMVQNKLEDAVACLTRALELRADYAEAFTNLSYALVKLGRPNEAVAGCRRFLEGRPDVPEVLAGLGNALQALGRLEEAVTCYRRALEVKPDFAGAYNDLGLVFQAQEKLAEAAVCFQRASDLEPDNAGIYSNLGNVLLHSGRLDEALQSYERSIELDADRPHAHYGRAMLRLLCGDMEQGWPEYEWRWKTSQFTPRDFARPRWDGSRLNEQTILLHAEQYLGDTIQFVRVATLVKKQNPAATIVVECQRPLQKLLNTCQGIDLLVVRGQTLPPFDVHAPLLSVPAIARTSLDSVFSDVPYLFADGALVAQWRQRLQPLRGLRVGVNWRGRSVTQKRDIPIEQLGSLAELPGVSLISLQKGEGRAELLVRDRKHLQITDFGDDFDTVHGPFMDTAAIIANLDLVITSDTSIPHLAGALGVPVWLALPRLPEWRWMLDRDDSPWYPTMRLFRQKSEDDWAGVFREIRTALARIVT
jgi:tetratricopeptide (TPR) repeat protein